MKCLFLPFTDLEDALSEFPWHKNNLPPSRLDIKGAGEEGSYSCTVHSTVHAHLYHQAQRAFGFLCLL